MHLNATKLRTCFPYFALLVCCVLAGYLIAFGSVILQSGGSATSAAGGLSVSGQYLTDGTHFYIGPNFQPATQPVAASFSWVNQGSATETASGGGLIQAVLTGTSTQNWSLRTQAISSFTTLTVGGLCTGGSIPTAACGLGFRESATGKLVMFVNGMGNGTGGPSNYLQVVQQSSPTSFNSAVYNTIGTNDPVNGLRWWQLQITGGNITFSTSQDGISFALLYSQAENAWFTTAPDQWFYAVNTQFSGSGPVYFDLLSWLAM